MKEQAWASFHYITEKMCTELGLTPEEALHIWRAGIEAFKALPKQPEKSGKKEGLEAHVSG